MNAPFTNECSLALTLVIHHTNTFMIIIIILFTPTLPINKHLTYQQVMETLLFINTIIY